MASADNIPPPDGSEREAQTRTKEKQSTNQSNNQSFKRPTDALSTLTMIFSCAAAIYIAVTVPILLRSQPRATARHILLVGGGWNATYNHFWYQTARNLGYQLSVADGKGHFAEELIKTSLVSKFFPVNLSADAATLTRQLIDILQNSNTSFDGIITFKDGLLIAVAEAAFRVGLPTVNPRMFSTIRSKDAMRAATNSSVKYKRIDKEGDIDLALEAVGLPAVLKPASGEGSIAVRIINSHEEALTQYRLLKTFIERGTSGMERNQKFVLEQFVKGTEHDVDLIIQDGLVIFASVSDEHEMMNPWFQETGRTTPSKLPIADQQALVQFAMDVCGNLGFTQGVPHIELIWSESKAYLVEVNARAGGLLVKHSIEAVWDVNTFSAAFQIAVGDKVSNIPTKGVLDGLVPLTSAINKYPNAPHSGYVSVDIISRMLQLPKLSLAVPMTNVGTKVFGPEDSAPWFLVLAMFVVKESSADAERMVDQLISTIDFGSLVSRESPVAAVKGIRVKTNEELLEVANTPVLGMQDTYGMQRRRFHVVSRILEDTIYRFGYDELQIPLIERATSFSEEIVGQSPWPEWDARGCFYFDITDYSNGFSTVRDKTTVLLVPEGTLSVARWLGKEIATNRENLGFPLKIFYNIPCFRNEPIDTLSQRKKRQFDQFGVEILGTRNLASDVEIIWILISMMERMGIPRGAVIARVSNVQILSRLLNDSGIQHKDGIRLKEAMDEMAECRAKKADSCVEKNAKSFWRILNNYAISDLLLTSWTAMINHESGKVDASLRSAFPTGYGVMFDELQVISEELSKHGLNVIADLCVVRSHEYYTHFSFEIDVLINEKRYLEIAGGGRYDKLVGHFLGVSKLLPQLQSKQISVVPSTGFAFGMQRVIAMLEDARLFESNIWAETIPPIPFDKATAEVLLVPDSKKYGDVAGYLKAQQWRSASEVGRNWSRVDTFIGDGWASPDTYTIRDLAREYMNRHGIKKVVFLDEKLHE